MIGFIHRRQGRLRLLGVEKFEEDGDIEDDDIMTKTLPQLVCGTR